MKLLAIDTTQKERKGGGGTMELRKVTIDCALLVPFNVYFDAILDIVEYYVAVCLHKIHIVYPGTRDQSHLIILLFLLHTYTLCLFLHCCF